MTESMSYVYCEFPERIADRLSYGENHPARRAFYKILDDAQNKARELKELHELVDFIEERINPEKEFPGEIVYLGLQDIEQDTGNGTI